MGGCCIVQQVAGQPKEVRMQERSMPKSGYNLEDLYLETHFDSGLSKWVFWLLEIGQWFQHSPCRWLVSREVMGTSWLGVLGYRFHKPQWCLKDILFLHIYPYTWNKILPWLSSWRPSFV